MRRTYGGMWIARITVLLTDAEADMVRDEAKEAGERPNKVLHGCFLEGLEDLAARRADNQPGPGDADYEIGED